MYLGASVVGGSHVRLDQIAGGPEAEESAGFRVYGGYRISEAFAFEMEFDMLPVANVDTTGINGVADLESYSVTANSKIFWLQERIQPYTIVGFGILHTRFRDTQGGGIDGSDFGAAFRFGAGLDFYITKHIVASAGAGYVLPVAADVEDRDVVTYGGGIQYRF